MRGEAAIRFMDVASREVGAQERALLEGLHRFTGQRLGAAHYLREVVLDEAASGAALELHAFLRECWEALDGLAREVNLCMHRLFPEAGLHPPLEMTRQCTFYVLRRRLHERPETAAHPVSRLLWEHTREAPAGPYRRLSFLYNLALFLPVEVTEDGRLPGSDEVDEAAASLVRPQQLDSVPVAEGVDAILVWLEGFAEECYGRLADALAEA